MTEKPAPLGSADEKNNVCTRQGCELLRQQLQTVTRERDERKRLYEAEKKAHECDIWMDELEASPR